MREETSVLWEMSGEHLPPHGWTRHGGRGQGRGHGGRRHHSTHSENPDVRLSKTLSYALRHGAHRLGLHMGSDGFVDVQELLAQRSLAGYEEADLRRVVESNDKQRFALRAHPTTGSLQIRANQGHSLQVEELDLQPITLHGSDLPECAVHGTFARHWPSILRDGLSRRGRAHIHMAPGEPGAEGVISGMRGNCEIAIYIDIEKALQDGIPFYRSANGVILSSGNAQGVLPRQYFQRVMQLQPERKQLPLEGDTPS
ncbi:tRNA 2'-phosphotransferase 1 isoform X1 [Petromyzon marinus]|uniref:2'-phosphotransferase n=3 Tax=Petromyzon marinus TaxID=7757 RepID=A0AAJ7TLA8_PETMA|nr:tRNA 2'-phosphotransferase 1 isoform X1 [Petromyzon marinus]XP_032819971.1 tRNA 2'-phosphotransferase 1 isoform X1 [Petromyzon marinus]